jgi:hypothetical protein
MQKILGSCALFLALALAVPGVLEGQDKTDTKAKDKVTKEDATREDYQNFAKMKEVSGKIAAVDVTGLTMTLTVDWSHLEPNKNFNAAAATQKAQQQQQQMLRDYNQIMQAKNPVQRQQALARLLMRMQQQTSGANLQTMFQVAKASKDFDVVVQSTFKVARSSVESKVDEQGELVKYTDEQLKKMKSPDITGAYTAKPEDLKVGQGVKLYLDPPKDDKKKSEATADKKSEGSATETKDKSTPASQQMPLSQVRMVLITEESNPMDSDAAKKKKKKDN